MNVDNQTILHIKAGHLPPDRLMQMILAKKPTAFGFGVQEADGADMEVMREDGDALDMDTLKSFLNDRKDRPATVYFGMLKRPYDAEDIQPFTITDPDDKTCMTLWTEGDIIANSDPAAHTEQFNFTTGVIIPKIVDLLDTFDGDISKVMAKLNGDIFKKDVLTHLGHRGILHVLPFVGEPLLISKDNTLGKEFDWGWISQHHNFSEKVEAPPVVTKKKSWGYGGKTKAEAPPPAPAPEVKENPPGVHTLPPKEKEPEVVIKGGTSGKSGEIQVAVKPPAWLHSNADIKLFYRIISGKVHPGHKKRLPAVVTQNHSVLQCKNLDEFKAWTLENFKDQLETSSATMTENSEKPMTKQERLASQKEEPTQGPVDNTPLPILDPKQVEKVLEFVAQHLDGNSKEIMPPHEMQKIEAQLPKFTDAVGLKGLEETLNWPVSGLFGLAATDPKAVVMLALQWRAYARPFMLAELKAQKKDGVVKTSDTVTTTTDLGNGGKKVESVSTTPPPAAKKKSWGYGKKAA